MVLPGKRAASRAHGRQGFVAEKRLDALGRRPRLAGHGHVEAEDLGVEGDGLRQVGHRDVHRHLADAGGRGSGRGGRHAALHQLHHEAVGVANHHRSRLAARSVEGDGRSPGGEHAQPELLRPAEHGVQVVDVHRQHDGAWILDPLLLRAERRAGPLHQLHLERPARLTQHHGLQQRARLGHQRRGGAWGGRRVLHLEAQHVAIERQRLFDARHVEVQHAGADRARPLRGGAGRQRAQRRGREQVSHAGVSSHDFLVAASACAFEV